MRLIFTLIILFCAGFLPAQNLLPNPSFEDTLPKTTPLYLPSSWVSPSAGSPDLFVRYKNFNRTVPLNVFGFQQPNSGNAYMGFSIYALARPNDSKRYREYIQSEMKGVLVQDSTYCLQLFVSLADSSRYASRNKLGVYFSSNRIQSNNFFYLPYIPQIVVSPDSFIQEKTEWLQFDFQYKALGGERYITIGNFTDSTEIDTLFVGGGVDEQWKETYYYIDDVYLGSCDSIPFDTNVGLQEQNLIQRNYNLFPNPASNQVNLAFEVKPNEQFTFLLYDLQGRLVQEQLLKVRNEHQILVEQLHKGLYLYQIRNSKGEFLSGKLVVE